MKGKFYSIIPHIDDDDLDAYQMRLLVHIRRRAGSRGVCFESMPAMARATKMGLARTRKSFHELAWLQRIDWKLKRAPKAKYETYHITPCDMMPENIRRLTTPIESDTGTENGRGYSTPVKNDRGTPIGFDNRRKNQRKKEPRISAKKKGGLARLHLHDPSVRRADGGRGFSDDDLPGRNGDHYGGNNGD